MHFLSSLTYTSTCGQLKDVRCWGQLAACDDALFCTVSWVKPIITDADGSEPRYLMADVRWYSYAALPAAAWQHNIWPILLLLLLHPFNGLFSRAIWVSQYQKGKTSLDLNEARDSVVLWCSCISWTMCKQSAPRSRDNHRCSFLMPNQQCQSTEGNIWPAHYCNNLHLCVPFISQILWAKQNHDY